MRRFPLLLLVAAAAAEGDLEREIEAFLATIRQEHALGAKTPFSSRIDADALVEEMALQGLAAEGLAPLLRKSPELLSRFDRDLGVGSLRLRRAEATPGGAVAVVDATLANGTLRMRLFLVRRGDAFRIRDFDMPDIGLKCSTVLGLSVQSAADRQGSLARLTQAIAALNAGDHQRALEMLEKVGDLPAKLEAVRHVSFAVAFVAASEYAEALEACRRAAESDADMPVVAYLSAASLLALDRHEEGLAAARRYVAAIGETADVCEMMGDAHAALGQKDEAAASFRAGLREDPAYPGNLRGLVAVRPEAEKEEIAGHLRRTGDAAGTFRDVGRELSEAEDWTALRALVAAYGTIDAGDRWIGYCEAALLRGEGKPEEAFDRVSAAMEGAVGEDRESFEDLHAGIAVECGKAVEAYEAHPGSFDRLATLLASRSNKEELSKLLERRAKDGEPDAAVRLWTLELAWLDERHEDVARLAARHAEQIRAEREDDAWSLDDRWIRSLVKLGREDEALLAARRIADSDRDSYYVLVVRVAFGRSAEAIRAFEKCVEEGYDPADLYGDEALAALADGAEYAALRARHPPPEEDE